MEYKKEKEDKLPFLYVFKMKTAIYCFILFILLSNKTAYNILNMILTTFFNRIDILNDKNEPTSLAIFIMAILFAIIIFIF